MATYCRGHPKSTWWDIPPEPSTFSQTVDGAVSLAILAQAIKDGNWEVSSLLAKKHPTEAQLFKMHASRREEQKPTGPQYTGGEISVPGVPGGLFVPADRTDPIQHIRNFVRAQVTKNTNCRSEDVYFSRERKDEAMVQKTEEKRRLRKLAVLEEGEAYKVIPARSTRAVVKEASSPWLRKVPSDHKVELEELKQKDVSSAADKQASMKEEKAVEKKEKTVPNPPEASKTVSEPVGSPAPSKDSNFIVALLFPGQGSQYIRMLTDMADIPKVQEYVGIAERVLGYKLFDICRFGPVAHLEETKVCQAAIFLASVVAIDKFKELHPEACARVGAVAGLSLGEYTALYAAGVFTFEEGMELVKVRGESMQEASMSEPQAMVSIAGLERGLVEKLCEDVCKAGGYAQLANVLFPKGFSVSGQKDSIADIRLKALAAGALQAKLLQEPAAFQTKFMFPAKHKLEAKLQEMLPRMKAPRYAIYMNKSAGRLEPGTPPSEIARLLVEQLDSPVLWNDSVNSMLADGYEEFFEVGPMKQLKAMMKRISPPSWTKTTNVDI